MLDIQESIDDDGNYFSERSFSRHDLNISKALSIAINNKEMDSMMFINIVRVAVGHRILLHNGKQRKQVCFEDDCRNDTAEDDEIAEILNDLK